MLKKIDKTNITGLTNEKKEILKNLIGSVKSPLDLNKMRESTNYYINGMQNCLDWLRSLPKEQAYKIAKENLIDSGIIDSNCNLTDRYGYSKSLNKNERR